MTARWSAAIAPVLAAATPDIVLVQGDTTSAYAAALAAHRAGLAVGHVEAGLRSFNLAHPWPEECNQVEIDRIAELMFAPTQEAADNLRRDAAVHGRIGITGNTGIDALLDMHGRLPGRPARRPGDPRTILLTCHRRENHGAGIAAICEAALRLATRPDVRIFCPVHPNPAVRDMVVERLGAHPRISLTDPLPYQDTVAAMAAAHLILTDSGGIQEEAPALGIPVLVLRETTERPEGIASGNLKLVGTDPDRIVAEAGRLLDDPTAHAAMSRPAYPFGRGDAAEKIADMLEQYFSGVLHNEEILPFEPVWTKDAAR